MTADSPKQAVANGHNVTRYDTGMCQKYVRDQCWRVGSLYGSAIEAWNGARYKHPGDRTPPVGAPTYYRGGSYGHAVIFCGQGHNGIRSTDCDSAYEVGDASLDWPERAWGYTYLGWTEDINGVRVIAPKEDEDMPLNNEDIQKIADAVWDRGIPVYDEGAEDDKRPARVMLGQTHNRAGDARDAAKRAAQNTK